NPVFLPDGRHFIYQSWTEQEPNRAIYLSSLDSNETTLVTPSTSAAIYIAGYLLSVRDGSLYARAFDLSSFKLTGEPLAVAQAVPSNSANGRIAMGGSQSGLLVYLSSTSLTARQFEWYS